MPALLSGPLFSIILIVLAGIALRYALWYGSDKEVLPDASGPDSLRDHNQSLQTALAAERADRDRVKQDLERVVADYDALKSALDDRESSLHLASRSTKELEQQLNAVQEENERLQNEKSQDQELCSRLTQQQQQLTAENAQLQEATEGLRTQLTELQSAAASLEQAQSELEATAATSSELEQQLVAERQTREELETALAADQDKITLLMADARFAANLRQEQGQLKTSLHESAQRLRDISAERDAMTAKLAESDERVAQLQDSIDGQNQRIQHYVAELQSLGQTADERVAELERTYQSQIDQLRGDREQFEAQLQSRDAELTQARDLATELTKVRTERLEVGNELTAALEKIDQLESIVAELESSASDVAQLLEERADLRQQLSADRDQIDQMETKLAELESHQANHDDAVRAIKTEKEELLHGLYREQERCQQLETSLASVEERAQAYDASAARITELTDRCEDLQSQLTEAVEKSEQWDAEREELNVSLIHAQRRVAELSGSVSRFEQELAGGDSIIRKLTSEKENVQIQLERERSERNAIERMLRVHSETLEQLRVDSQSLESLLERQTVVQQSLQEHAERLRAASGTQESQILSMEEYETESAANEKRVDPVLGSVYLREPLYRDDLKRISGVGEVLEQRLNELGIYTYEQVLSWDAGAIEEFSNLLSFKDRIVRDEWQAQARRLHEESILTRLRAA